MATMHLNFGMRLIKAGPNEEINENFASNEILSKIVSIISEYHL